MGVAEALDVLSRIVRTAIGYDDDLEMKKAPFEVLRERFYIRFYHLRFFVAGDDNGNLVKSHREENGVLSCESYQEKVNLESYFRSRRFARQQYPR